MMEALPPNLRQRARHTPWNPNPFDKQDFRAYRLDMSGNAFARPSILGGAPSGVLALAFIQRPVLGAARIGRHTNPDFVDIRKKVGPMARTVNPAIHHGFGILVAHADV